MLEECFVENSDNPKKFFVDYLLKSMNEMSLDELPKSLQEQTDETEIVETSPDSVKGNQSHLNGSQPSSVAVLQKRKRGRPMGQPNGWARINTLKEGQKLKKAVAEASELKNKFEKKLQEGRSVQKPEVALVTERSQDFGLDFGNEILGI